ncbi:MAG: bifunctional diaminohydroxyphosphoribosylaminopyrimidine deaminase/5-amino-6-(5-phosphoribosylamino)uracil reductase RibD [Methylocystaceae bacterium]|jgi:diaminohydroxyphosphoribosylaminopyrimidine deaminase / 5-amino-6-(5-phosphoribosylamino)uracil reductase|nr:bifunctional diaminohydroxyphosphoribosylaminopyrimidine deaminase/5-amino-6-(5-phosphoribosylamino)uracil reductase RibD [Methylocystaceae bacterium]
MTRVASVPDISLDDSYMACALALGRRNLGLTAPNPSVGALVVKEGVVIGRGWTGVGGRPHAEVIALKQAGALAVGATLYVTLEPCAHHGVTPPCVESIVAAGIARVVSALEDPNPRVAGQGHQYLRQSGIELLLGVGAAMARLDHMGHILRMMHHRPMVTLKLAQTADGYAAGAAYDPRLHITGPVADAFTHVQRAMHDAIMIGAGTAREDDPLMTVRLPGMDNRRPLRIVLDPKLSLSPRSRLVSTAHDKPLLIVVREDIADEVVLGFKKFSGADVARIPSKDGLLNLHSVLRLLSERGVTRVFSEGGPTVAESLLSAGLADEIILHQGVKPLGRLGKLALTPAAKMILRDENKYRLMEKRYLGVDQMMRYARVD